MLHAQAMPRRPAVVTRTPFGHLPPMHSVVGLALLAIGLAGSTVAAATTFTVAADDRGNAMTAVFDSAVGERITAVSPRIACTLTVDEDALTGSGRCSIPLTSIAVDNTPTKSEHFQQWATNKKTDPAACTLDLALTAVRVPGPVVPDQPVRFMTDGTFTVCGRARDDGGAEHLAVTLTYLPAHGEAKRPALRIRAQVEQFDRERYGVSPRATAGWLARVEQLSDVVAPQGVVDVSIVAVATP